MNTKKILSAANQGENFQIVSSVLNSGAVTNTFDVLFSGDNADSIIFALVVQRLTSDNDANYQLNIPTGWTSLFNLSSYNDNNNEITAALVYRRPGSTAITGSVQFTSTYPGFWRSITWVVKDQNPNIDPVVSGTRDTTDESPPSVSLPATNMHVFSGWILTPASGPTSVTFDAGDAPHEEFYYSGGSTDNAGHVLIGKHPDLQGINYNGRPDWSELAAGSGDLSTFQLGVATSSSEQFILSATASTSVAPKNSYGTTATITVTTSTGAFTATCASGMEISTNGGSTWSSSASLNQSDTFILRAQNTGLSNTARALTINLGGVTKTVYTFTVDSRPKSSDTVSTKTNAGTSTTYTSDITTISNLSASETVTISGTGSSKQFRINGGSWVTSGTISNGQTLQVRQTSSSSTGTSTTSIAQVGGVTVHTQTVTTYSTYVRYIGSTSPFNGTSTTASYTVPDGVTSISIACIGGGNCGGNSVFSPSGGANIASGGGGGGGFSASNGVTVTPGETLTVVISNFDRDNVQNPATRVHRSGTNLCRANCASPNSTYTAGGAGASTTGAVGTLVTRAGGSGGSNASTNRGGQGGGPGTPTGVGLDGTTSTSNGVGGTSRQGITPTSTGFTLSTAGSPTNGTNDRAQDGRNYGGGGGGAASISSTNAARYDGDGAPGSVVILVGRNFSTSSLSY